MRVRLALLLAPLAAAGCGGPGGGTGGGTPEQQFAGLGCASCHTMRAAGAKGRVGPNLDEVRPSAAEAARQIREGGGAMPAYAGRLSDAEIRGLAEYVARSTGG